MMMNCDPRQQSTPRTLEARPQLNSRDMGEGNNSHDEPSGRVAESYWSGYQHRHANTNANGLTSSTTVTTGNVYILQARPVAYRGFMEVPYREG
jgi:hypothetical protein